jgi:hypothetical protein
LLVLATIVAIACGGDTASGPNASPVGGFQLSSFNGKGLPTTLFQDTAFMDVLTAGSLKLSADGTYLATISIDETVEGHLSTYVDSGSGKWTQAGAVMQFVGPDSVRQAASWDGTSITLMDTTARPTSTMVFTKR